MNLKTFITHRLPFSIIVLLGLSILIFSIARVIPGDPVRVALGDRVSEEVVERVRKEMFLDRPIHVQYYMWIRNMTQGELGRSLFTRREVSEDIKEFFPATLELALLSGFFMSFFGILLGTLAAQRKNSWVDNIVRVISYLGVVTPAFVFAILFVLFFGYVLEIFPTAGRISVFPPPRVTGMMTIDSLLAGNLRAFWNSLQHLILPSISLSMASMAQISRITRSSMSDNLQKDYIQAHKTYGISQRKIMFKYLMKPSLIPSISILGISFAALISNAFLVEMIFNWPGLSRYGINAILSKDLNAITGVVMVLGLTFVVVNILVDFVVAYLDPRIRMRGDKG